MSMPSTASCLPIFHRPKGFEFAADFQHMSHAQHLADTCSAQHWLCRRLLVDGVGVLSLWTYMDNGICSNCCTPSNTAKVTHLSTGTSVTVILTWANKQL